MEDGHASDIFSDGEPGGEPEAADTRLSENQPGSASPNVCPPAAEVESDSAITPLRPVFGLARKRKAKVLLDSDSSSGEDSDNDNTEPNGMGDIKDLLKRLVEKVEKNSRALSELQNHIHR